MKAHLCSSLSALFLLTACGSRPALQSSLKAAEAADAVQNDRQCALVVASAAGENTPPESLVESRWPLNMKSIVEKLDGKPLVDEKGNPATEIVVEKLDVHGLILDISVMKLSLSGQDKYVLRVELSSNPELSKYNHVAASAAQTLLTGEEDISLNLNLRTRYESGAPDNRDTANPWMIEEKPVSYIAVNCF